MKFGLIETRVLVFSSRIGLFSAFLATESAYSINAWSLANDVSIFAPVPASRCERSASSKAPPVEDFKNDPLRILLAPPSAYAIDVLLLIVAEG